METLERVFGKENRAYLMGIAISWIVLFHVWLWCSMSGIETAWWLALFDKGALGVDIFLLLSAFGLQASIERNSLLQFYKNRAKRLFPVYLFFLLTLFLTFERHCPIDRMMIQSLAQVTGFSLFQYPEFFSCGFCFDWFTPAIILLYICFPLVSKVVQWICRRGLIYELAALVVLVVAAVLIRERLHIPFGLLALRMPIIFLGIVAYIHQEQQESGRLVTLIVAAACLGLLSGNEEMRLSLLMPPLLMAFAFSHFALPLRSFVSLVGRHSFEVYLAHIFVVAFFIPTRQVTNPLLLLLVTVGSAALLATLYSFGQKVFWQQKKVN